MKLPLRLAIVLIYPLHPPPLLPHVTHSEYSKRSIEREEKFLIGKFVLLTRSPLLKSFISFSFCCQGALYQGSQFRSWDCITLASCIFFFCRFVRFLRISRQSVGRPRFHWKARWDFAIWRRACTSAIAYGRKIWKKKKTEKGNDIFSSMLIASIYPRWTPICMIAKEREREIYSQFLTLHAIKRSVR